MEDPVTLVLTAVGTIAGVASAYLAHVAVRGRIRRPRGEAPRPPEPRESHDVFVSYAAAEADVAERLARDLEEAGASVFLVRWVEPGLRPLLEAERALAGAALGVLLFGPGTMADARIQDEYAALLTGVYERGLRFVPARTEDVTLPGFAAIRQPVDLTEPGGPRYAAEVARLAEIATRLRGGTGA
ncbi:toll/interleukin-1 receptor domain-containing protein [Streptomyces sp. S.PNR 29]|uniref:toll/interleukin-1 receptor domain-containing protein n=1 Tax=Streptomyces sp. S.PNR 29 TaxID=2973805 RepID=UPI0025B069C2|nr:toll/interleukin-1 receptor domain-containing protein [Streptomyces sp. S.PNR 29]MDN0199560.1 toll/interleukin-1 receptor domain-containing protein [Streptomyces sp. S.PNR 29]